MLSCKEVTQLISESLDRPLSRRSRFGLRFHMMMCRACRLYKRQVEGLHRLIRLPRPAGPADSLALSPEKREQIKQLLKSDPPADPPDTPEP